MIDPDDFAMYILARWKGDNEPEFYIGVSGYAVEGFHDRESWSTDAGESIPFLMYDAIERDVSMMRLIYTEYTFGFYSLTFTKKDDNNEFEQTRSTAPTMDDPVCADID